MLMCNFCTVVMALHANTKFQVSKSTALNIISKYRFSLLWASRTINFVCGVKSRKQVGITGTGTRYCSIPNNKF